MKLPVVQLLLLITPAVLLDMVQYTTGSDTPFMDWPLPARVPVFAAAIALILLFSSARLGQPFVYQGF